MLRSPLLDHARNLANADLAQLLLGDVPFKQERDVVAALEMRFGRSVHGLLPVCYVGAESGIDRGFHFRFSFSISFLCVTSPMHASSTTLGISDSPRT